MRNSNFGIIGLGTMGRNLLLNIVEKGFVGTGYDPSADQRDALSNALSDLQVKVAESLEDFVMSLERPRKILILVPAAQVAPLFDDLVNNLESGDVVVDCGNSFFKDTERNNAIANERGIKFFGAGVSGGERGARNGASIMVGGDEADYHLIEEILVGASTKFGEENCCALVGPGGAGHFVKMIHNGIEYSLMQSIAEAYDLLRKGYGFTNREIADVFGSWNSGVLNSFLLEISAGILRKADAETGKDLVDLLSDVAGQKGTGMWTSTTAMEFGVPVPSIDSAVSMRQISSSKTLRVALGEKFGLVHGNSSTEIPSIQDLEAMLLISFLSSFAQGFMFMKSVSDEKSYGIDLKTVASIWRGGCIIRAALLSKIMNAFESTGSIHLFEDGAIGEMIGSNWQAARKVAGYAVSRGVPFVTTAASLGYLEAMSSPDLPTNLIQAQRDHFGAHTYRRKDREGIFHTEDWL